jgi:hypothetical protein
MKMNLPEAMTDSDSSDDEGGQSKKIEEKQEKKSVNSNTKAITPNPNATPNKSVASNSSSNNHLPLPTSSVQPPTSPETKTLTKVIDEEQKYKPIRYFYAVGWSMSVSTILVLLFFPSASPCFRFPLFSHSLILSDERFLQCLARNSPTNHSRKRSDGRGRS